MFGVLTVLAQGKRELLGRRETRHCDGLERWMVEVWGLWWRKLMLILDLQAKILWEKSISL
jgi:hypothetical protein